MRDTVRPVRDMFPSMKVPPKRKGNAGTSAGSPAAGASPSMKVPPKRKGNGRHLPASRVAPFPQ